MAKVRVAPPVATRIVPLRLLDQFTATVYFTVPFPVPELPLTMETNGGDEVTFHATVAGTETAMDAWPPCVPAWLNAACAGESEAPCALCVTVNVWPAMVR